MKKTLNILCMLLASNALTAQEVLTMNDAIAAALSNNHRIMVLKNQQVIAENNVHPGVAGLLPGVTAGASIGGSLNNTELEFAGNIPSTKINGAQSSNLAANATLNYVVFNGLNGQLNYQKLKLNKLAVDEQSRAEIEGTILMVAQSYLSLAQAQDQLLITESNLVISKQRYERAEIAADIGTGGRSALLAARVDLTSDSAMYLQAKLQSTTARRSLERLMGQALPTDFRLEENDIFLQDWSLDQLESLAMSNNASVKNMEIQSIIAEKSLKQGWSPVFPVVNFSAGYNYNNQQTEAGIVLANVSNGWNGMLGISYNLFNSFKSNINRQNQRILLENSKLLLEDRKLQLRTDLAIALDNYRQSIQLLLFEEQNLASAELNLERADEMMRTGQFTNTQFREAQVALANARMRISNSKIAVRLHELNIMLLTGQLLSEG